MTFHAADMVEKVSKRVLTCSAGGMQTVHLYFITPFAISALFKKKKKLCLIVARRAIEIRGFLQAVCRSAVFPNFPEILECEHVPARDRK